MAGANVKLSKKELLLVCDVQFILTKNHIISKVYELFGELNSQFVILQKNNAEFFPPATLDYSPKIYKGEQYQSLPYVLLDNPRMFTKEAVFAIRCFFWWGNFFSITLHVAGSYTETYSHPVFNALQSKRDSGWFVCVNENEWEHHFATDNYIAITEYLASNSNGFPNNRFFKIAKKIPLHEWDTASDFFMNTYTEIMEMLRLA
jgi:hypothetical protein